MDVDVVVDLDLGHGNCIGLDNVDPLEKLSMFKSENPHFVARSTHSRKYLEQKNTNRKYYRLTRFSKSQFPPLLAICLP